MKRSQLFVPSLRQNCNAIEDSPSASYLERAGYIDQIAAGIYAHLPLGHKLFNNLKSVLHRHLERAGAALVHFPALHPASIWKESGRLELFGQSMFRFCDRSGRDMCLAPTHEVLAAFLAKRHVQSYRDLPFMISQTQTKFRDEVRPRAGVIRTREFTMQDLYSFDTDHIGGRHSYDRVFQAYSSALTEMCVPFLARRQEDMGAIGGIESHEFHVVAPTGDDSVIDPVSQQATPSLEVAHTFMLGDKYSVPINATFVDSLGTRKPIFMCSFGMGIERTAAAFIESHAARDKDFTWSWNLAPYQTLVISDGSDEATSLYHTLQESGISTLLDDRTDVRLSRRIKESIDLGVPIRVVFGRVFEQNGLVDVQLPIIGRTWQLEPEDVAKNIKRWRELILAVERASMSFRILHVDDDRHVIYVQLENQRQLLHSYCATQERGTDLLGNFGFRKEMCGDRFLVAANYRLAPIATVESDDSDCGHFEGFHYLKASNPSRLWKHPES